MYQILIGLGVALSATALAFLLDKDTKDQQEQQETLRKRTSELRECFKEAERKQAKDGIANRALLAQQMASDRAQACQAYMVRVEGPLQEFTDLAARLRTELSDPTISPYRRNALRLLQARLEDTRNRLSGYQQYGKWYLDKQEFLLARKQHQAVVDFPDPGNRLPEDWLYNGMVGLISPDELGQRNTYGQNLELQTTRLADQRHVTGFQEAMALQYHDQDAIPVQVLAGKNPHYFKACVLRGAMYVDHIRSQASCRAVVTQSRYRDKEGDGYELRCFPSFYDLDLRRDLKDGIRAFLPSSESSFAGKRYVPGEILEVYLHQHDLLLRDSNITATQHLASLQLGSTGQAIIFIQADISQFDIEPLIRVAQQGAPWQLCEYEQTRQGTRIVLRLGPWQVETFAHPDECQLSVTALAPSARTLDMDMLPFSVRLIDQRLGESVYTDVLRFHAFIEFCRQQDLFGQNEAARVAAGQFFERWSKVNLFLLEESGYESFPLTPVAAPQDREWDCVSAARLANSIQALYSKARNPGHLYIEELYTSEWGERWLRLGELKGIPEPTPDGRALRLHHAGIRPPDVRRGYRPMQPPSIRIRVPNGGELANLDRQKRALQAFMSGRLLNPALKQILLMPGLYASQPDPYWVHRIQEGLRWHNPKWQAPEAATHAKRMIEAALMEPNLFLLQGPPGTGKTTSIVELLHQLYSASPNAKVLVVSQQNTAVDNALGKFLEQHPEKAKQVLRIASDATKVQADLRPRVTDAVQIDYLIARQKAYSRAAALGEAQRAAWIDEWIQSVYKQANDGQHKFDEELTELLIEQHSLIGATCVGLASRRHGVDRQVFDICIVDEGGRATVPELLIPLMRCRKAIIIGDHYQLPPSVASRLREADAKESLPFLEDVFLKTSFFEQLFDGLPTSCKGSLRDQYRMVEPIGDLVADLFYSQDGVRGLFNGRVHDRNKFLNPEHTLIWHDVPAGRQEKENKVGPSLVNTDEAEAIRDFLIQAAGTLLERARNQDPDASRSPAKSVAIITPYGGQKRQILSQLAQAKVDDRKLTDVLDIEVDTVDSFQGSEADIVLYSTVRTSGNISFLLDRQRLNVACSRARENLVFFGCARFLKNYEARSGQLLFTKILERAHIEAVSPPVFPRMPSTQKTRQKAAHPRGSHPKV